MGNGRARGKEMGEMYGKPFDAVGIGRAAGTATVLFIAKGFDDDGIVKSTYPERKVTVSLLFNQTTKM